MFHGTGRGITVGGVTKWARTFFESGSSGNSVTVDRALQGGLQELNVYGWCSQNGTPTPVNPVDIECNNGLIKYGWRDIITSSQLSGYGTYVSPTQAAQTRAYRWFENLPNGTYTFAVDGDYEIIVQWRDPANPADGVARFYENLTGWITSGVVTLDKSTGGYGVAVRRTDGTTITPSNFDGVLRVQEQRIYTDGTDETITITDENGNTQSVTMPMLLSVGNAIDVAKLVDKVKRGKCLVYVVTGTEEWGKYNDVFFCNGAISSADLNTTCLSTHYVGVTGSTAIASMTNGQIKAGTSSSTSRLFIRDDSCATADDLTAKLTAMFEAGTPLILVYSLNSQTSTALDIATVNFARWLNTVAVNKVNSIARNLFDGYYKKMV